MRPSRGVLLGLCAALLVTTAACGADEAAEPDAVRQVRLYGSDGNMSNSFGEQFKDQPGLLAGMKGTSPLTELSADFRNRLLRVDPKLNDFAYAAEAYDAVVITILATELAGVANPKQIARHVNGVTAGGRQCETVRTCLELARDGVDLKYRGVSLQRGGFTDAGEPAAASYATLHFGTADRIDDGKTEFVGAGDETSTTRVAAPAPRGRTLADPGAPLKIGGLLPMTGSLSFINPPMVAGAKLAIGEANASGGALGEPVEWLDGDDGTNPATAKATIASHVAAGVHVIIGAGASGVTRAVLPQVVAAGLMLFSPSNTAADLSRANDRGLYFRTAPSDLLQGKALADVILRDGTQKIVIIARKDAYGEGLQANVVSELEKVGLSSMSIKTLTYVPPEGDSAGPVSFAAEAQEVKAFQPDAVLIIGYAESAQVIKQLAAAGVPLRH